MRLVLCERVHFIADDIFRFSVPASQNVGKHTSLMLLLIHLVCECRRN